MIINESNVRKVIISQVEKEFTGARDRRYLHIQIIKEDNSQINMCFDGDDLELVETEEGGL